MKKSVQRNSKLSNNSKLNVDWKLFWRLIGIFLIIFISVSLFFMNKENINFSPGQDAHCTGYGATATYTKTGDASCGYYLSNKDKHRIYPDQNAKPVTIKSFIEGNINDVKTTTCSSTSYCNSPVDAFVVEVIDSSGDKDCYNKGVLLRNGVYNGIRCVCADGKYNKDNTCVKIPLTTYPDVWDYEGELEIIHIDNFEDDKSEFEYYITTSNKKYRLIISESEVADILKSASSGSTLKIKGGALNDDEINVYKRKKDNNAKVVEIVQIKSQPKIIEGTQKVLVLIGKTNLHQPFSECSSDIIRNNLFSSSSSVKNFYLKFSNNKVVFDESAFKSYGPINVPECDNGECDRNQWTNLLDSKATQMGVDLSQFNKKMYVMPYDPGLGGSAAGQVGSSNNQITKSWYVRSCGAGTLIHELGHNLGMWHANYLDAGVDFYGRPYEVVGEYGDNSDIMGHQGSLNAPHKEEMGWIPPEKIMSVNNPGTYSLASIDKISSETGTFPQIIKIPVGGAEGSIYLSFRTLQGFFDPISGHLAGTNIHRYNLQTKYAGSERNGAGDLILGPLFLKNIVNLNEPYTDSQTGVTITQKGLRVQSGIEVSEFDLVLGCTNSKPEIIISSPSFVGDGSVRGGNSAIIYVTIDNADSLYCSPTTFSVTCNAPIGWNIDSSSNIVTNLTIVSSL